MNIITDKRILHTPSKEVDINDKKHCEKLAKKLLQTFKEKDCRLQGISAIQIGYSENACLIRNRFFKKKAEVLFNLIVVEQSGSKVRDEGCLSEPGVRVDVARPKKCVVEYDTLDGKHHVKTVRYPLTRVYCHEADHMKGILLQDIGSINSKQTEAYKKYNKLTRRK